MKKTLLGTSALLGAGLITAQAGAADGVKLTLGGFFRTAYMMNFDDDNDYGAIEAAGHSRNLDGVFTDAEIHFRGETTLDNGVTVGVRVELEGEQANDQIDEAFTYFKGGFGELRIGSDDDALANSCITPPGATANFGAFSPNQIGAVDLTVFGLALSSNTICTGVDGDSNKLIYFSPIFAGFQLSLSYTPHSGTEAYGGDSGNGPHIGMPVQNDHDLSHNFSAYLTYTYEGDGWGLSWGGGGSWSGRVEDGDDATVTGAGGTRDIDYTGTDAYQTALNVTFGGFKVGGAFEYFDLNAGDADAWVAGGGVSYNLDAWTVGFQYSHQESEGFDTGDLAFVEDTDRSADRFALTGIYNFGPGIDIESELAYTIVDSQDRYNGLGNPVHESGGPGNDYDAFEVGIGTAITF